MSATTSIRVEQSLYEMAKLESKVEHRTIAGQIEFWAKVGRAAIDNPDLPINFIVESLASLAEDSSETTNFVFRD